MSFITRLYSQERPHPDVCLRDVRYGLRSISWIFGGGEIRYNDLRKISGIDLIRLLLSAESHTFLGFQVVAQTLGSFLLLVNVQSEMRMLRRPYLNI